jgi:hypothetical protein
MGTNWSWCGRTVDDSRYDATVVDVVQRPDAQHRGVGTRIVRRLQARLESYLLVTLTAAEEVQPFSERLGWRHQRTAMPLPRDDEQERRSCDVDASASAGGETDRRHSSESKCPRAGSMRGQART